jgi:hypothetical protein
MNLKGNLAYSSKNETANHPFGTELDVYEGYEWINDIINSISPY